MKRAKQMVWDLGRANSFDWWVTCTFSPEYVDNRSDYKCCSDAFWTFTHFLTKKHCRYLFVPDWDTGDGIHFHGLVSGNLKFVRAYSPYTGKPLFDNHNRPCYNISEYKLGFSSAVPLDGSPAVITYLTQYYTKNRKMQVPKGCKRYWASRNLIRPEVSYDLRDMMDFLRFRYAGSRFAKNIESRFGDMIFAETTEEQVYAQLERAGREEAGTGSTQQNKVFVELEGGRSAGKLGCVFRLLIHIHFEYFSIPILACVPANYLWIIVWKHRLYCGIFWPIMRRFRGILAKL